MELTIHPYRSHNSDFVKKLAADVLDGKALVNWMLQPEVEDVAFLPVKQALPEDLAKIRAECGGLYFFGRLEWAMPQAVRGVPVFMVVEPLSRFEADWLVSEYKDEKARRIAHGSP